MRRAGTQQSERGAALLTVLMIVAAMSVAALAVTQAITNAAQRARALDAQAQLGFYEVSAEEVAKSRLTELLQSTQSRVSADLPGFGEPQIVPVDGGNFNVIVRDASNCFNVNALVNRGEEGRYVSNPEAQTAYLSILTAALEDGFDADPASLVSSLTDWMDDNSVPGSGGAEDSYYQSEVPSYRTSSQTLINLDELRAIRGYTRDVTRAIKPLLCALPPNENTGSITLNVNTLEEKHAPLLQLAFGDALELREARELISLRPLGGWDSVETMLQDPILQRIDPAKVQVDRLGVVTSLVEVSANVSYRGYDMTMRYLFHAESGRPLRTLRRERIG